jgi:hypothetical protein
MGGGFAAKIMLKRKCLAGVAGGYEDPAMVLDARTAFPETRA